MSIVLGNQIAIPIPGFKSMLFTHDGVNHIEGYVQHTDSTRTETWQEVWVRVNSDNLGGNRIISLMGSRTSGDGNNYQIRIVANAGGTAITTIRVQYYDDPATGSTDGTISFTENIFHLIRVHFKAATGVGLNDGIIQVYFDDTITPVIDLSTVDNDTKNSRWQRVGNLYSNSTNTGLLIYFDDFKLGSTAGGSEYFSANWNTAVVPETEWNSKVDTGNALSLDTGVYH